MVGDKLVTAKHVLSVSVKCEVKIMTRTSGIPKNNRTEQIAETAKIWGQFEYSS